MASYSEIRRKNQSGYHKLHLSGQNSAILAKSRSLTVSTIIPCRAALAPMSVSLVILDRPIISKPYFSPIFARIVPVLDQSLSPGVSSRPILSKSRSTLAKTFRPVSSAPAYNSSKTTALNQSGEPCSKFRDCSKCLSPRRKELI